MNHEPAALLASSYVLKHAALAVFGGLVHALSAYRSGQTKGISDVVILTVISSFSGIMFALLALHTFPNQVYFTFAAAGAGGFLGVEGLTIMAKKLRDSLLK